MDHPDSSPIITLTDEEAATLTARLEALARTARIFGSGVADVDVHVTWSLEPDSEQIRWFQGPSGRRAVDIRLQLNRMIDMLRAKPGAITEATTEESYVRAFKTGFLHELGHILFSSDPVGVDLSDESQLDVLRPGLPRRQQALLESPRLRRLLETVHHILEDGRIERNLMGSFRGARRYLESHAQQALRVAYGQDRPLHEPLASGQDLAGERSSTLNRLVALVFLDFWGWGQEWDRALVPPRVAQAAERLSRSLDGTGLRDNPVCLSRWVVSELLPELDDLIDLAEGDEDSQVSAGGKEPPPEAEPGEAQEEEAGEEKERGQEERGQKGDGQEGSGQEEAPALDGPGASDDRSQTSRMSETLEEQLMAPGLLAGSDRPERAAIRGAEDAQAETSCIIVYPHVNGGRVIDEISVVRAGKARKTDRTRQVLADVQRIYGPRALDAFAAEAAALRRAFQVNFERKYEGRHRTGRHVGIRNLRCYVVADDLRIFQRMEVPDRLSYYIHLLLDVSPSMLTNRNLQKAMAIGFAFAQALDSLRVPVDVSLYSSAITELYDHRRDSLDLYFGSDFGYLSSGTHEIEAIAYAKQVAEKVSEERKIIVVTTDGQPNGAALQRAGADDIRSYYRDTLLPWLGAAGIDMLAIGIGSTPSYHPNAAAISSGWESIGVFMRLLDDIIAQGVTSHAALWR